MRADRASGFRVLTFYGLAMTTQRRLPFRMRVLVGGAAAVALGALLLSACSAGGPQNLMAKRRSRTR
jgi:hypothetical protein